MENHRISADDLYKMTLKEIKEWLENTTNPEISRCHKRRSLKVLKFNSYYNKSSSYSTYSLGALDIDMVIIYIDRNSLHINYTLMEDGKIKVQRLARFVKNEGIAEIL